MNKRVQREPIDPELSELLTALIALIPAMRDRGDLGFSADAREDALMDALVTVLQREHALEPGLDQRTRPHFSEGAARSYALKVVRNRLIDNLRSELRRRLGERVAELPADLPDTSASADQADSAHALLLDSLLNRFHERDADLLRAYLAGDPYFTEEVSRQALRRETARVRIHRLIKRARTELKAAELTVRPSTRPTD